MDNQDMLPMAVALPCFNCGEPLTTSCNDGCDDVWCAECHDYMVDAIAQAWPDSTPGERIDRAMA